MKVLTGIWAYINWWLDYLIGPPMVGLIEVIRNNQSVFLSRTPASRFTAVIVLRIRFIKFVETWGGIPTGFAARLVTPARADYLEQKYCEFLQIQDGVRRQGLIGKLIGRFLATKEVD